MTREERIAQIRPLREQGLTYREIAEQLGISVTYARRILNPCYDTAQTMSREAKRRRTGQCVDCGATTRYGGQAKTRTVSTRCVPCAQARIRAARRALRGTGPTQQKALIYLSQPRTYSELRDHLGITSGHTSFLLHKLLEYGLIERVSRGVYQRTAP